MGVGEIGRRKPLVRRIIFSLLTIILVLVLIASINFVIFRTGDDSWLMTLAGSPELQEVVRDELRLDEHIVIQYFDYLVCTFTGDFYTSTDVRPFADVEFLIYHAVLRTVFLLVIVSTVSILLGMVWGRFMSKNAEKAYGKALHVLAVCSLSFPVLYLALSILVTAYHLDIGFPTRRGSGFDEGVVAALQHAILPTLSLIVAGSGFFALVTRAGLLRAERLGEKTTSFAALDRVNPFPYFLFPLVMIGIYSVDIAYGYGGLGTLTRDAMLHLDMPVLMACFFVISVIVFFSQLAFRAVRERSRFMHPIDGVLGPSEGTGSHNTLDLRRDSRERLSIYLLVTESKKLAGAYRRHKSGVAALIVLAIFLVMGLFADVLSTVPNPWQLDSSEPNVFEDGMFVWMNPLPPSLTESPYTGFLHPLGTDNSGGDLYSMNLYAAGTGMVVVLTTCAFSLLCGLFVGFLSIVSAHYSGFLSRLGRHTMGIVSLAFLAILGPLIAICILASHYPYQGLAIEFLLILSIYCWAYRTITWPLSNSIRSVISARRWNETGTVLRDSLSLFRCGISLVLSRTFHVTKYLVVFITVFSFSFGFEGWLGLGPGITVMSWDIMLTRAYSSGAFVLGYWWTIVPPLLGIVALAVSSYFCLDTLERVFDERCGSKASIEQPVEETPGSDSDVALGQMESESEVPASSTESSE